MDYNGFGGGNYGGVEIGVGSSGPRLTVDLPGPMDMTLEGKPAIDIGPIDIVIDNAAGGYSGPWGKLETLVALGVGAVAAYATDRFLGVELISSPYLEPATIDYVMRYFMDGVAAFGAGSVAGIITSAVRS
jgi:hypothetical protein